MKQTRAAMRLDFLTIRQYLTYKQLGLYAVIIAILSFTLDSATACIGVLMMYGLFYASYPFAIGEKMRADLLYATLPLERRHLVFGRYLFALCINLCTAAVSFVLCLLVPLVQGEFLMEETLLSIGACFYLFTLVEAFQFPLYFKLGYTKAKLVALLPLMLTPVLVIGGVKLAPRLGWTASMDGFPSMTIQNPLVPLLGALLLWMIAFLFSIRRSFRVYKKREF